MKPKLEYNYYEKKYTESDIIDMFGADVLKALHDEECDFDGNDWQASTLVTALVRDLTVDAEYEEQEIILYAVYKEPKGLKQAQEDGDIDTLDWEIDNYQLS